MPTIAAASGGGPSTATAAIGASTSAAVTSARARVPAIDAKKRVQRAGGGAGGVPRSSQAPISGVTSTIAIAVSTSPAAQSTPSWRTARISESPRAANAAPAVTAASSTARAVAGARRRRYTRCGPARRAARSAA